MSQHGPSKMIYRRSNETEFNNCRLAPCGRRCLAGRMLRAGRDAEKPLARNQEAFEASKQHLGRRGRHDHRSGAASQRELIPAVAEPAGFTVEDLVPDALTWYASSTHCDAMCRSEFRIAGEIGNTSCIPAVRLVTGAFRRTRSRPVDFAIIPSRPSRSSSTISRR